MIGSLFSGVDGLALGLERATGLATAWQCEYDRDASTVLADRFSVPNLHDITTVDWADVEPVVIVCGGFPCQPFSTAGRRKGTADERWMWPEFARCVRALRPCYVVVENVAALLADTGAFGAVLGDLAEAGYDARWTCLRAADVGAPHRRERLFLVATDTGPGAEHRQRARSEPRQGGPDPLAHATSAERRATESELLGAPSRPASEPRERSGESTAPANASISSSGPHQPPGSARALEPVRTIPGASGGDCSGHPAPRVQELGGAASVVAWGNYEPAIRRWEAIHGIAPAPVDDRGRLSPAFVEWMMGFPPGWVTDSSISRSAQLRCLGNAVVPHCAAMAWHVLAPAEVAA